MTKMYVDYAVIKQALEFVTSEAWGTTPYMDVRVYEDAARLRDVLQAALRAALAQQDEPVQAAERERERVASQWDGCVTHQLDTFGPVDIGASIRAGELVEAQQAEPVEPVAWECKAGGLKPLTQRQYDAQTVATKRHYTRIAPPQRTMVPLTEDEIYHATRHCGVSKYTAINITRAVEQAHGIKE